MSALKILLADDHREFLEVASRFLAEHNGIDVVGSARSGKEAVQMAHDLAPDVVLMDLSMPGVNGLEATRQIKGLHPPPLVVMLTMYDAPEIQSCARAAGADHFITKSEFGDSLPALLVRLFPGVSLSHTSPIVKTV